MEADMGIRSDEVTRVWRDLFCITDHMRDSNITISDHGLFSLTFNQLRMIKIVHQLTREAPGGITLKTLAESLSITPAAASEMVDALVRKEVLCRDHNPQDRRAVAIRLSDRCRERVAEGERNFDRQMRAFLNTLSAQARSEFLKTVSAMREFIVEEEEKA